MHCTTYALLPHTCLSHNVLHSPIYQYTVVNENVVNLGKHPKGVLFIATISG